MAARRRWPPAVPAKAAARPPRSSASAGGSIGGRGGGGVLVVVLPGLAGGAVLGVEQQLLAEDRDIARRLDPEADQAAVHLHHGDLDIRTDPQAFPTLPTQDEHVRSSVIPPLGRRLLVGNRRD